MKDVDSRELKKMYIAEILEYCYTIVNYDKGLLEFSVGTINTYIFDYIIDNKPLADTEKFVSAVSSIMNSNRKEYKVMGMFKTIRLKDMIERYNNINYSLG